MCIIQCYATKHERVSFPHICEGTKWAREQVFFVCVHTTIADAPQQCVYGTKAFLCLISRICTLTHYRQLWLNLQFMAVSLECFLNLNTYIKHERKNQPFHLMQFLTNGTKFKIKRIHSKISFCFSEKPTKFYPSPLLAAITHLLHFA